MALLKSCFLVLALLGFYASAQQSYKCDFEQNICSFLSNDRRNYENWKIGRGKLNSADTGPSVDHTLGTDLGGYLFVNVSAAKTYDVKLQTIALRGDYCVRFFYHMYGADIGSLTVYIQSTSTWYSNTKEYFFRSKTQGDRWKEALFTARYEGAMDTGYKVIFKAKHASSTKIRGDIALDDVELTPGKCADTKREAEKLCSFDDYNCGYTSSRKTWGSMNWEWKAEGRRTSSLNVLPNADHTLGTSSGGYWFIGVSGSSWSTNFQSGLQTSTLTSPNYKMPQTPFNCLHFYFYMDGDRAGFYWQKVDELYLQAQITYSSSSSTILVTKAKNTTRHRVWTYAEAKAEISKNYWIAFTAGIKSNLPALVAVDDIKLFPGSCPEAGSCDFEEGKCTWVDGDGNYTWIRKRGNSKANRETGPSIDNTLGTGNGNYVVVSTNDKTPGGTADLESEVFPPGGKDLCLSFYYYLKGQNVGKLAVVRKEGNMSESVIWLLKTPMGNRWNKAAVSLKPSALNNQVVFRAIIGTEKDGFFAVDDIRIRAGEKCDLTPPAADPRYEALELMTCNFDDINLCSWKQDPTTLEWKFGNGSLLDSTGPQEPLNGKGHYIFVSSYEGNQSNYERIARIQSPVMNSFAPEVACFSFYYHMFGVDVGELRVIVVAMKDQNTPLGKQVIWRRKGTQPDKWLRFRDTLAGDIRIEIEAEGGSGFVGSIAIDDIVMSLGACSKTGVCDFESNFCGWNVEPNKKGDFYWKRGASLVKGPKRDHTTRTEAGHYLLAYSKGAAAGEETSLTSPKFSKNWGPHCVTFWYYRPGLGVGKITVNFRKRGKDTVEWSADSDVGKFWHYGQVNVDTPESVRIVFKAQKGQNDYHQMAIDDLWIKNSGCDEPGSCSFNNDYCSYSQNETSDFAWLLGTGRVVNTQLVDSPPEDNSVENGMYVYADMTSQNLKENQAAVLVSELLEESPERKRCLKFAYHINGADKSTLSVGQMILENIDKEVTYRQVQFFNLYKTTGKGWAKAQLNIPAPKGQTQQIYFSAIRGNGARSFIALDDITVEDGMCSDPTVVPPTTETEMPVTSLTCDFDKGTFCSWKNDMAGRQFSWKINTPGRYTAKMPKFDHTKGNYIGRYAYLLGDGISNRKATITSEKATIPKDWNGNFCFSFWYFMNVEGRNSLSVTAEHGTWWRLSFVPFWTRQGNFGYRWRHAFVHIKSSIPIPQVRIIGDVKTGVIALDDFAAKGGSCPPSKICTFDGDNDMCGFTQDSENILDWEVKSGEDNTTMYRMPDHTTGSIEGSYLYIGFNGTSQVKSQRSRIYTPKRPASSTGSCVTFYYHIYNVSKLSLNVYLATDNGISDPQWTVSIGQGLLWHGARFSASPKIVKWQVLFEVNVGNRGYGQVAIDDISVENGNCPDPGYCDFEKENCLWENVRQPFDEKNIQFLSVANADVPTDLLKSDFDWVRHIGIDSFGPPKDHTLGSPQGFYLLLDTRAVSAGEKAVYVSERLRTTSGVCLSLWYATSSYKNGASLQVYSSGDFTTADQIKMINDTTNNKWTRSLITVALSVTSDVSYMDFWVGVS
ncbi:MAM and LDL-receptor class A domain-containing protein 1-like [Stegodyphus dumicola]|uniref:MAM and LDL-receptor class A domain-containing protein 1-like n=1 Tax=Stegodyphus dumicola TaxID=202533 RepID=UPI0015AC6C8B|nr:MAM and LDL-receptor class A domain-containing protein 1-like [Stegodyphus dumicola]